MSATDALDTFLERRDLLPKRCPSWCTGGHEQALEEGCDLESSSRHDSSDHAVSAFEIDRTNGRRAVRSVAGNINVCLRAQHQPGEPHWEHPFIEVDAAQFAPDGMRSVSILLTSGEARSLARQLVHLADLNDLG